jgi:hypothetical protein
MYYLYLYLSLIIGPVLLGMHGNKLHIVIIINAILSSKNVSFRKD